MRKKNILVLGALACMSVQGFAQTDEIKEQVLDKSTNTSTDDKAQSLIEQTAAVSTVSGDVLSKRTSRDITESLIGYLPGLTTIQKSGLYSNATNSFYVRGIHSSSGSNPLILVDGIERDATYVTAEEVESVSILKDAAAVALYGYKGANGVINITTKRGKYNTNEIKFSYDQMISWNTDVPDFVDGGTYAEAYNEAMKREGSLTGRYSAEEVAAFKNGSLPYLYPSVNWAKETFRNASPTSLANISFRGGGETFRYYALANLQVNKGFIKNAFENEGYSTQNKYSRANLRINLDANLSPKTKMIVNLLGTLSESSKPGTGADLWNYVYNLPSNAMPVKLEDGTWAGSNDFDGTKNPVAQSVAAAYDKQHIRSLFADLTLRQDFSSILKGLGGSARIAYDNLAAYYEDHSKTYVYAYDQIADFNNGDPITNRVTGGTDGEMGEGKSVKTFRRNFNFDALLDYDRTFGNHSVFAQLKWDYEYRNTIGLNNTYYRQNFSLYTHYGYKDKYLVDLTLVESAANRLSPHDRWAFSPTVAAGWVISKENFMKNLDFIDLLKLRASFGIINTDKTPYDGYWEQNYGGLSSTRSYAFMNSYSALDIGSWGVGTLASVGTKHEKAYKYNVGLDIAMFKGLTATIDAYYEHRNDIWVNGSSKYSSVLGKTAPYVNAGIVNSWGTEIGINYNKQIGQVTYNLGGSFSYARSKVDENLETPKLYPWLSAKNLEYGQIFGYEAIGLFKDEADIAASPTQTLGGVVRPGDIKYKDLNGDNKIDSNDMHAIGHSTIPETNFSFNLGAEWKGLGFNAMFQGTGRCSAMLNTAGLFRPLLGKTALSQYYYDNRWTPEHQDALFPRLSTLSNQNNYQNSTWWLKDASYLRLRNLEVYYKFPKSLLSALKVVDNAKIYVRGIDLLCFDHIKNSSAEMLNYADSYGATNPLTRSVVVGLQIGF